MQAKRVPVGIASKLYFNTFKRFSDCLASVS